MPTPVRMRPVSFPIRESWLLDQKPAIEKIMGQKLQVANMSGLNRIA